jgi:CubicO group peptidase (beta-lactamase class C family)
VLAYLVEVPSGRPFNVFLQEKIFKPLIMPNDDLFGPLLTGMGYGLGFAVLKENNQSNIIGSTGSYWWAGAGNTYFYIDHQEDLILIFMTQFVPNFYYPICKEFRKLVYRSIVK